nr:BV-like protein [Cotesia vestalis bracovirus]
MSCKLSYLEFDEPHLNLSSDRAIIHSRLIIEQTDNHGLHQNVNLLIFPNHRHIVFPNGSLIGFAYAKPVNLLSIWKDLKLYDTIEHTSHLANQQPKTTRILM